MALLNDIKKKQLLSIPAFRNIARSYLMMPGKQFPTQ